MNIAYLQQIAEENDIEYEDVYYIYNRWGCLGLFYVKLEEYLEEVNPKETNNAFTSDDYDHFESLIH